MTSKPWKPSRLEPLACRIHDAVVVSGTDEEQEMCFDWYQSQAIKEPCPACSAIEEVLREELSELRKPDPKYERRVMAAYMFMVALSFVSGYLLHAFLLPWLHGEI